MAQSLNDASDLRGRRWQFPRFAASHQRDSGSKKSMIAKTGLEDTATTQPHIAVVDDDPSVIRSLARLLRSAGYAVRTYNSAQDFLTSLATLSPQCLVLDVQMPAMNGFELQARLRDSGCSLPVVFITAHDTAEARASARRGGAVGLLPKPFDNNSLLAVIGRVLASPEP
jgi:FixJ family two-component response regulator